MMSGAGSDIVGHFQAGFEALKRYPMLVLPPLAVHVLLFALLFLVLGGTIGMGAVMGGMAGGGAGAAAGGILGLLIGGVMLVLVMGLLSLVASGVVVVMAREALAAREPRIGDALGTVMARLADVVIASFLVTLVVGIGMLFLVIPGVVAGFFLIFTLPAVLLDGRGAGSGLRTSFDLVKTNPGVVVGLAIGTILVFVAGALAAAIVQMVPVLGHLASLVIFAALVSYTTVVGVGVYQALRPA